MTEDMNKLYFNTQRRTIMSTLRHKLSVVAFLMVLVIGVVGCGDDDDNGTTPSLNDIVDTAIAAGNFNTLVAAVQAAGLEDTLRGPGPFTVFAPTDDAFANLPAGTLDSLLLPENQATLQNILLYHVVSGEFKAADVVQRTTLTTVQGQDITITVTNGNVMIDNANVTTTDIVCSNGVIHVIDAVILPQ
jgi:uncharacterized surface protein with fasciclin (FAS1) repeats